MSNFNKVIQQGRLVKDPELRYTNSGTPVTNIRLAIDSLPNKQTGEARVDFIPVTVWGKQAENIASHCMKGQVVTIEGHLRHVIRAEEDGSNRHELQVHAQRVIFGAKPMKKAA
ncbi:MAG: single-stranded DNA-binding protein B [Nitrospirales bacterium]|nr:MAG: single-stranded DNA-binding protein B [Nitrospirales bacterium]